MNSLINKHKFLQARIIHTIRSMDKKIIRGESKLKERKKQKIREKLVNKTDPAYTGESSIPHWDEKKGRVLYKFMNQFVNINRLTRKVPDNEKSEYIKKQKEYNLYMLDKFRKQKAYNDLLLIHQKDILQSAALLPSNLKDELTHKAVVYFQKEGPNDCLTEEELLNRRFRFTYDHLYLEQKMRVSTDEARMLERINRNSYREVPKKEISQKMKDAWEETNELRKM